MAVRRTWLTRDLPVLEATLAILTQPQHPGMVDVRTIAEKSGMDPYEIFDALQDMEGTYVRLQMCLSGSDPNPQMVTGVTPAARIAVGQWPSVEVLSDRLLASFREAEQAEPDPIRKSNLRAASDARAQIGQQVLAGVISAAISGHH